MEGITQIKNKLDEATSLSLLGLDPPRFNVKNKIQFKRNQRNVMKDWADQRNVTLPFHASITISQGKTNVYSNGVWEFPRSTWRPVDDNKDKASINTASRYDVLREENFEEVAGRERNVVPSEHSYAEAVEKHKSETCIENQIKPATRTTTKPWENQELERPRKAIISCCGGFDVEKRLQASNKQRGEEYLNICEDLPWCHSGTREVLH